MRCPHLTRSANTRTSQPPLAQDAVGLGDPAWVCVPARRDHLAPMGAALQALVCATLAASVACSSAETAEPLDTHTHTSPAASSKHAASEAEEPTGIRHVFEDIYQNNKWNSEESKSGPGSSHRETRTLAARLEALIERLEAKTVVDAACGDFNWMRHIPLPGVTYLGLDIVPELIRVNTQRYAQPPHRTFKNADFTQDPLPRADLIICRDVLVHLSNERIHSALKNFKDSGSTYLLATHFTGRQDNHDIDVGDWRAVNLTVAPFHLPAPIAVLEEAMAHETHLDGSKQMGLWRLADL